MTRQDTTIGGDADDIPVFNRDNALKLVENDTNFLQELFAIFLSVVPEQLEQLSRAIAGGQMEEGAKMAHKLKSMSVNLGAERFQRVASCLEKEMESGDRSRTGPLFLNLKAEFERFKKAIEAAS